MNNLVIHFQAIMLRKKVLYINMLRKKKLDYKQLKNGQKSLKIVLDLMINNISFREKFQIFTIISL